MTDLCCSFQVCTVASRQQFKYKLHDCFSDVPICCLGTWCPCVLWGMNASFGMGAKLVAFVILLVLLVAALGALLLGAAVASVVIRKLLLTRPDLCGLCVCARRL